MAVLDASCPRVLRLAWCVSSRAFFVGVLLILTSLFATQVVAQAPSAPTNLTATAGDGKVDLSWTAPPEGISGYAYKYTSNWGNKDWTATGSSAASYTVTGLRNNFTFTISIRALSGGGNGAEASVSAKPNIAAPTGFTATPGDKKVTLSWTAISESTLVRYDYQEGAGGWISAGKNTTVTLTNMQNGNSKSYRVRSYGTGAGGTPTASQTVTPRIPAPTGLTATAGNGKVDLSWAAPTGLAAAITRYEYSQDDGTWTSTGGTSTSYTVTGLANGTEYTFKVRAQRTADIRTGFDGGGAASDAASATPTAPQQPSPPPPQQPPPPPSGTPPPSQTPQSRPALGAPTNLKANVVPDTATNTAKAILTWSAPSNAKNTGEEIRYAYRYKSSPWTPWKSTGSSSTTYTVTGLEIGKAYTFEIGAFYVSEGIRTLSASNAPTAVSQPQRRIILKPRECPLGWTRGSVFGNTQKALIYELKVEADPTNTASIYQLKSIAIYVHPDENLETLDGWTLQVGTLYNQFGREFKLTAENSVIDEHDFAHIENPEETPIPMGMLGYIGQSLPSFDYRLYDAAGVRVDFGISCYKGGGLTWRLWNTEDPRLLRVLPLGASEEALSVQMENLDWRTPFFRSEWTAAIMPDLPAAPAAPSQMKGNIVGTWGDLKKQ